MASPRSKALETPPNRPARGPRGGPRWIKEGTRFASILAERNIGQTEFAARIGRKFHNVHRWCKGYEFGPNNQAIAALALGLARDAFAAPSATQKRQKETRAVLAQFAKRCLVAASLTPEEWLVLRSIRFDEPTLRPTVAFFEAVSFALRGAIRIDEIMSVAEENAALDASLAHKPPLRRR